MGRKANHASPHALPLPGAEGVLPSQALAEMIRAGQIRSALQVEEDQIQPASLDLRLDARAYRVRASFLPGRGHTVRERIGALAMHEFELGEGAVLERGCVYIVPLMESLALPEGVAAVANPKSSTGRLDVFTRVLTDRGVEFDQVREGYRGPLYAEITPRTFSVLVRPGTRLCQMRVRRGAPVRCDVTMRRLQAEHRLIGARLAQDEIRNGLPITVDVRGDAKSGLIGYRARAHAGLVDMDRKHHYPVADFWEPVHRQGDAGLVLDPGEFYILASKEAVRVPKTYAAEMVAYDTLVGEFRVHYAGFFDPGFGDPEAGGRGARAVLEVRSFEVPFVLEHGQLIGRLIYEPLTEPPQKVYGRGMRSHYQRQGLQLSKHFRRS